MLVVVMSGIVVLVPLNYWLTLFRNFSRKQIRIMEWVIPTFLFLAIMGGAVGSLAILPEALTNAAAVYGSDQLVQSWGFSLSLAFLLSLVALGIFVLETGPGTSRHLSGGLNTIALFMVGTALTHEFVYPFPTQNVPSFALGAIDFLVASFFYAVLEFTTGGWKKRRKARKRTRRHEQAAANHGSNRVVGEQQRGIHR